MRMIHAHPVLLLLLASCLVLLSWLGTPSLVHSATPEEIGLKIAKDASAKERHSGNKALTLFSDGSERGLM